MVSHDNGLSSEVSLNHLQIPALCDLLVNEHLAGTSLRNNQTIYAQVSQNLLLFLSVLIHAHIVVTIYTGTIYFYVIHYVTYTFLCNTICVS